MSNEPSARSEHVSRPLMSGPRDALSDFEARLSARTKVPSVRLTEYMAWSDRQVKDEAQNVARVLKRFAEAVVNSMEALATADDFLRDLDLKSISRDHDWRAIFSTIRAQSADYNDYKRAVLIKYLQYLSFRKRLLEFIYSRKAGLDETDAYTDLTHISAGRVEQRASGAQDAASGTPGDDLIRLPLGESVDVKLPRGRKVELMMAGHMFRLLGEDPPCLIDQNGVMYFLKPGRNMVGRHPESDVVIDPDFGDVSRAHLIIDWQTSGEVCIMDFSSRGTYMRSSSLSRVPAGFYM